MINLKKETLELTYNKLHQIFDMLNSVDSLSQHILFSLYDRHIRTEEVKLYINRDYEDETVRLWFTFVIFLDNYDEQVEVTFKSINNKAPKLEVNDLEDEDLSFYEDKLSRVLYDLSIGNTLEAVK
jgi:hypothetical protein